MYETAAAVGGMQSAREMCDSTPRPHPIIKRTARGRLLRVVAEAEADDVLLVHLEEAGADDGAAADTVAGARPGLGVGRRHGQRSRVTSNERVYERLVRLRDVRALEQGRDDVALQGGV